MSEADAEDGIFFRRDTIWYDERRHDIEFEFCILIFEFRPHSPKPPAGRIRNLAKRTLVEEKRNPYPQEFCFRFSESAWITTLVERGRNIKIKKNVEREISFNHLDLARNSFELCPTYTAFQLQKYQKKFK